ncbi:MAG TPA: chitosanase, partial [Acidobacteriota bacterium]|nr:chitosanase [Acidobacteriota bacterium]
ISLLEEAGKDPVMSQAQDEVFDEMYWNPAMDAARKAGVESPLGKALLYDTAINSGPDNLNKIIASTQEKLAGKDYSEEEFLKAFSEERKDFILDAANRYRGKGDAGTADMLVHVASDWRMDYWNKWLDAGNLQLTGDLKIYKQTIHGGDA